MPIVSKHDNLKNYFVYVQY